MLVSAALLSLTPVILKRSASPDEKAAYSVKALIDLGGRDDVRFEGTLSCRVRSVVNGTVTIAAQSQITVDVMGVARQGRPVASERIERVDGSLVQGERFDSTLLFAVPRVDRLRAFVYPSAPVEIGAGWWHTEPPQVAIKAPPYASYLKLEGEEKIGERDAWRTSVDATEVDTDAPVHVKGMLWLDKKDGSLVRGQWTVTGYVPNASTPPMSARIELSRTD